MRLFPWFRNAWDGTEPRCTCETTQERLAVLFYVVLQYRCTCALPSFVCTTRNPNDTHRCDCCGSTIWGLGSWDNKNPCKMRFFHEACSQLQSYMSPMLSYLAHVLNHGNIPTSYRLVEGGRTITCVGHGFNH